MNKEKLDTLLANGSITQEEYEELVSKLSPDDANDNNSDSNKEPVIDEEKLEKLIQAKVDKITSKLGKEKAELQKQLDKLKKDKLTEDEIKQLELSEKEEAIAERERALLEKENRLYAIKEIKVAGLDDGTDKSLELVEFVLSDSTEEIDRKIKAFGSLVKKFAQSEIDRTFKENGRNPNASGKGSSGVNPYAKETFNLTEQMKLEVENPELANQLKAAASK